MCYLLGVSRIDTCAGTEGQIDFCRYHEGRTKFFKNLPFKLTPKYFNPFHALKPSCSWMQNSWVWGHGMDWNISA